MPPPVASLEESEKLVLSNLVHWGKPREWPERPVELRYDDYDFWEIGKKRDRGEKLHKEERDQLELLSQWKRAVRRLENEASGKLQVLMSVLHRLEAEGDREVDAAKIRAWVEHSFECRVPAPSPNPRTGWTRRYCERFGMNLELLPRHVRLEKKPPKEE